MALPTLTIQDFLDFLVDATPRRWIAPEDLQPGGGAYAVLHAVAANDYMVYNGVLMIAQRRQRLTTALGKELDDIANGFFGFTFPRYTNEVDSNYRTRIVHRLVNPIPTIAGITQIVQDAIAVAPVIYDRQTQYVNSGGYLNATDINAANNSPGGYTDGVTGYGQINYNGTTGYYNAANATARRVYGTLAYNTAGTYAITLGAYQALVTVQQPEPTSPYFLTYKQIMDLLTSLKPNATVLWARVIGPASTQGLPIF